MRKFFVVILLVCTVAAPQFAQSGRVNSPADETPVDTPLAPTAAALFDEASGYAKKKYSEFQTKKIPYSEKLERQTVQEQKQLAAKNAAILLARSVLAGEDLYFLGMLHWIAENFDGTAEALKKFAADDESPNAEKLQAARSVLVILAARKKNFDEAEKILSEYLNTNPTKPRERARMETELAASYRAEGSLMKAAAHAEEAYRAAKTGFAAAASRAAGINELLESGMLVFEIYRDAGAVEKADKALEDLQQTAVLTEAAGTYFVAADARVKYLIETGRKSAALQFYRQTLNDVVRDFKAKGWQDDILARLRRREKHYEILGETAPELVGVARWFPGEPRRLAELRGKVVLLDFWATWCGPCYGVFPSLISWHRKFEKDGLVILGVTRYYGSSTGAGVKDNASEIEFLQKFRTEQNLPYDFVVGKQPDNQIAYGAASLPTTVLIDRRGVVRYAEIGFGKESEVQKIIEKLLAEK